MRPSLTSYSSRAASAARRTSSTDCMTYSPCVAWLLAIYQTRLPPENDDATCDWGKQSTSLFCTAWPTGADSAGSCHERLLEAGSALSFMTADRKSVV